MKYSDIKNMQHGELWKRKREIQEEMFVSKLKNSLGQLSNPLVLRFLRRDLARVNTALVVLKKQATK